jgi:arylsulfatase A-like enzyme
MLQFKSVFFWLFSVLLLLSCTSATDPTPTRPNVLFISVDDLRPELGVYGNTVVKTPHMDALANSGSFFSHHYVQVPTCGASRYSLMTGLRPQKKIHISNSAFYEETASKKEVERPESFVHHLKRNGYTTVGIGKISHSVDGWVYDYDDQPSDVKEMPHSWDRFIFNPGKWKTGWNAFFGYANGESRQTLKKQVKPYEIGTVSDDGYPDGLILNSALSELKKLKAAKKPFFLGVGFFKPHLPFNAPKKYWDLYERSAIPIAPDPFIPEGVHQKSMGRMGEFYNYESGDEKPNFDRAISDDYAQKLIHGYYASISYIDQLVGKLLTELKALDMDQNTLIVLWGDHGWHLGNDLKWGKHTLFERSLKSTLIIKIPEFSPALSEVNAVVESVDIFPTIMEYCGIEVPYKLDGNSLIDYVKSIPHENEEMAYGYFKDGVSIRTPHYRLTKFYRKEKPTLELYDHRNDPQENKNIATGNEEVIKTLMPLLDAATPAFYKKLKEH